MASAAGILRPIIATAFLMKGRVRFVVRCCVPEFGVEATADLYASLASAPSSSRHFNAWWPLSFPR